MRRLIVILGIPIDDLNMDQALDRIENLLPPAGKRAKLTKSPPSMPILW
ncbi:MAG: hypothetical protein M5U34_39575 [Chloroflexi bacterium]|nr:hypothetical protein [Chloroflexota bacterium]